jgi:NADH-quinone oxidoreductase subunit E
VSNEFSYEAIDRILNETGRDPSAIIGILQGVQEEYRYLPPEIFPYLAGKLGVSEARIYSVATFYENFSLDPKGEFIIKICDGTACHVRKSIPILSKLREELGLSEEKVTTDDLGFTVETVSCLGACGLAPVMTINDQVHPAMTPEKASELLDGLKAKRAAIHSPSAVQEAVNA